MAREKMIDGTSRMKVAFGKGVEEVIGNQVKHPMITKNQFYINNDTLSESTTVQVGLWHIHLKNILKNMPIMLVCGSTILIVANLFQRALQRYNNFFKHLYNETHTRNAPNI